MKYRHVDVAVIGAGSAGLRAFRAAAKYTDDVVLIEGGHYGTTCARVGCMPSKLLIAAAEAAHHAAKAPEFGVQTDGLRVSGPAVMERVRSERDRFVGFVVESTEAIPSEQRLKGYAHFLDDHRLQVGDDTIVRAKRIVIATGSSSSYPKSFESIGDRLVVNDDIFDWQTLPERVAVFGPGVIGLELGQALHRLGVEVVMFGIGGAIGPVTDPKVHDALAQSLQQEFYLDADAKVTGMERIGDEVQIDFLGPNEEARQIRVDYVIAATGRRPNLGNLRLENTSLPVDEQGLPKFDTETLRIGQSHVFIAGDVNNDRPLLHEAADEGNIAGTNAGRFPFVAAMPRRSPLAVVFSDPQIGMAGSPFADLSINDIVIGEASFEDQGRSRVMLQNRGLLRVYADRNSGRFLGAEMVGPRAEHLAHLLAWSHQAGLTVQQMLDMPYYHPVVEEGLRTALSDAQAQLKRRIARAA